MNESQIHAIEVGPQRQELDLSEAIARIEEMDLLVIQLNE